MWLLRSPGPTTSAAPARDSETGRAPSTCHPPDDSAAANAVGSASSPELDMIRFFGQEADWLHTAATILTEVTEDMLKGRFRKLTKSKGAIDAVNMAESISKNAFLGAEKRYRVHSSRKTKFNPVD